MHTSKHTMLFTQLHQELTVSIVALDLCRQSSTEDTPQVQGIRVPIFGEDCPSKPLT